MARADDLEQTWLACRPFAEAFAECVDATRDLYTVARELLPSPPENGVSAEFRVGLTSLPEEMFAFRRNLFSTIFQAVYGVLELTPGRRRFHAQLNYLFRLWVTSADNLLDNEDKRVLPVVMPGGSHIMRQVVGIMAGDRILFRLLARAVADGVISAADAAWFADESLRVLLPSAAEEGAEEAGVTERPDPEYVLHTIHLLKTGLLFQLPFAGLGRLSPLPDLERLEQCRRALTSFGIGCQLLDDVRDMARDYVDKRHNYLLSDISFNHRTELQARLERLVPGLTPDSRIYAEFPDVVHPVAVRARELILDGLLGLANAGLALEADSARKMAGTMFAVLDVKDLSP